MKLDALDQKLTHTLPGRVVRQTLSRNYVRADESEKIKAINRHKGKYRVIDKVKARPDTQADRFWAELVNMGVGDAVI